MAMKNKRFLNILNWLTSTALLLGIFAFILKNGSMSFKNIHFNYMVIALLPIISLIHSWLTSILQRNILFTQKINLNHQDSFSLSAIADLYNFLLPAKSGSLLRMIYLKENFNFSKRKFLSMSLASAMAGLSSLGLVGFLYTHFFFSNKDLIFVALESLFLALMIAAFFLVFSTEMVVRIFKLDKNNTPQKYLSDFSLVSNSITMYLISALVVPIRLFISFYAIGLTLSPLEALNLSLILIVISWIQILPGNLGIKEIALAYLAQKFGISYELSLIASLIDRGLALGYMVIVGKISYWRLFNNKNFYLVNVTLDKLIGLSGFLPKDLAKESSIK